VEAPKGEKVRDLIMQRRTTIEVLRERFPGRCDFALGSSKPQFFKSFPSGPGQPKKIEQFYNS
jgi:hypothetical protein